MSPINKSSFHERAGFDHFRLQGSITKSSMGSQVESTKRSECGARFSQASRDDLKIRSDLPHMNDTLLGRASMGPCYDVRESLFDKSVTFAAGREAMYDERKYRAAADEREAVYVSSMGAQVSSQEPSAPAYSIMSVDRPHTVLSGKQKGIQYTPETEFACRGRSSAVGKYNIRKASQNTKKQAPKFSFSQTFLHESSRPPWCGLQPLAVKQDGGRFIRGLSGWSGASGGDIHARDSRGGGGVQSASSRTKGASRQRQGSRSRRKAASSSSSRRGSRSSKGRATSSYIPSRHSPAMMRRLEELKVAQLAANAQSKTLSTTLQHPSFSFGKASRRGPETWLRGPDILTAPAKNIPGPGHYGGQRDLRRYDTSVHKSSPAFGFSRSTRFGNEVYSAHGDHTRRSDISIAPHVARKYER